ncbi:MAG TPA: AI-2E family transporter [Bacteroidaceae bacterium]|nr:AI-2E family transporter [Bacteroidaceae bacterium]
MRREITFDRFIRGLITIVGTCIILYCIHTLRTVLLPFFIAWLFAYLMQPLVHFLQKNCRLRFRILAILVSLLIVFGVIGLMGLFIVPPTIAEFSKLKVLVEEYISNGMQEGGVPQVINDWIRQNINGDQILLWLKQDSAQATLKEAVPQVWNFISSSLSVITSLFSVIMVILYLIFMLMDYDLIMENWIHFVPQSRQDLVKGIFNDVTKGMQKYFRGQSLVASCVGILLAIGFSIIGFPMGVALGLFIGILNLVPYLQIVGLIPMAILALLKSADTGGNFWIILGSAFLVLVIVQTIQDTILVPRIMGKITGLRPAIILLSLTLWGSIMGVVGMIVALPFTTIIISYYKRYLTIKDENDSLREDPDSLLDRMAKMNKRSKKKDELSNILEAESLHITQESTIHKNKDFSDLGDKPNSIKAKIHYIEQEIEAIKQSIVNTERKTTD